MNNLKNFVLVIIAFLEMNSSPTKKPTDVVILFEATAMVGTCFDSILENYIKPIIQ